MKPMFVFLSVVLLQASLGFIAPREALGGGKVSFNLQGEPKTLDPGLATGVTESYVINTLLEGLTLLDEKGQAVPAMAERWDLSEDKRTYTFHLRDAVWSNGEPVTANDFVYGWRRILTPETAAEYAYQLFLLEGAEDFNAGKTKDAATIGVRAVTTNTLEVRLKSPAPYFLSVLAHYAYSPLNEKWVTEHPRFASEPAQYLSNGPFTMSEWRHNDRIIVKKNPKYHSAASVKLDEVEFFMITNESTALLQWQAGKLDLIETYVPLPDMGRLKKESKVGVGPYFGVYYVALQNEKKPFDDPRVRRAFAYAVNRDMITKAVLKAGEPSARALVPPGVTLASGKDYRAETGELFKEDIVEAKRLLAEAGYPNGRGFPKVKYLYNDVQAHRTIAEALQRMWMENLNVRIDLQVQEWKVYLQNLHTENYQMARAGWIGDFLDPVAFLDMYQTNAGNNDFKYSNLQFDKLVADSRKETDEGKRMEILRSAEKLLMGQDMPVIPIYFYVNPFLQNPRVKGIVRNATSSVYFHHAYVEGN